MTKYGHGVKYILDLLPYKPTVKIYDSVLAIRILTLLASLANEVIESTEDFFLTKNMINFDAHVGENLCQIRACLLLDLEQEFTREYEDKQIYIDLVLHLKDNILRIEMLIEHFKKERNRKNFIWDTVEGLLEKNKLNIILPEPLHFLTVSHFLSKFKMFNEFENTIIDYERIISHFNLSKNICRRIIHCYQKDVASYSFEYILNHASFSLVQGTDKELVRLLHHKDDDDRDTLPCYIVMLILFSRLKAMKKDILLIIREEQKSNDNFITLLYTLDEKKDDYVLSPYLETSENGFVIHAITQHLNISQEDKKKLINQINRMGLITSVMANMASHHQYSGFKLAAIKENPFTPLINHSHKEISKNAVLLESTFSLFKEIAYEYGYSEQNAAIFFIRHIFCDRLDRQVRFALDNIFYSQMSENLLITGHSPINTLCEAISC